MEPNMTELLHFTRRNETESRKFFNASTNSAAFTLSNYTKYLGLLLDGKLNWNINIQSRHICFLLLHKTVPSSLECIQIWNHSNSIQRSRGLVIIFRGKLSSNPVERAYYVNGGNCGSKAFRTTSSKALFAIKHFSEIFVFWMR